VTDPLDERSRMAEVIGLVADRARAYLATLDDGSARRPDADRALERFGGALPEEGDGALEALAVLLRDGLPAATHSAGPRFFHFVQGGVTPAALGADWIAATLDQNTFSWVASPLGSRLEALSLAWLKDLLALPAGWGGVLTTGATLANFTALAAARRWWGERHGADVDLLVDVVREVGARLAAARLASGR
jgi:hypothetical protein